MKYLPRDVAFAKMQAMVDGAKLLRREFADRGWVNGNSQYCTTGRLLSLVETNQSSATISRRNSMRPSLFDVVELDNRAFLDFGNIEGPIQGQHS